MDVMGWFMRFIKSMFIAIDRVVYSAIEQIYELFILISEAGIFSQDTIQAFAGRIYVFLGLVMIFVVSISMVQYILDPKKFNDAKIGGAKLIKDFVFVLGAIILVPYGFELAFKLQRIILKDNIIGSLILGIRFNEAEVEEGQDASYYATYGGKVMAYATASAFVTFNKEVASFTCINQPVTSDGKFNEACGDIAKIPFEGRTDDEGTEMENVGQYTEFVHRTKDFRNILDAEYVTLEFKSNEAGDLNLIDYSFLLSTIAGAFIIYILLGFCIDVAVRSVKLGFLQLIAPVPIMMKIIPGNGQKKFDAWLKQCVTTYMDVFTRLAAIYFAIFIISAITTDGIQNVGGTNFVDTTLVHVAIIFGALMFASELPKLLSDIIGGAGGNFKMGGPIKKIMSSPISGAVAGGVAGGAVALGANTIMRGKGFAKDWDSIKNHKDPITGKPAPLSTFEKFQRHSGQIITPLTTGIKSGAKSGATGKSSLYKSTTDASQQASEMRAAAVEGYTVKNRARNEYNRISGQKNNSGEYDSQSQELSRINEEIKNQAGAERSIKDRYSDDIRKLQELNYGDYDFEGMFEREFDPATGVYGEYTEAANEKRMAYEAALGDYQEAEDNYYGQQENLMMAEKQYQDYQDNVRNGKEQEDHEKVKNLINNVTQSKKDVAKSKDEYLRRKEANTTFNSLKETEKKINTLNTKGVELGAQKEKLEKRKEMLDGKKFEGKK